MAVLRRMARETEDDTFSQSRGKDGDCRMVKELLSDSSELVDIKEQSWYLLGLFARERHAATAGSRAGSSGTDAASSGARGSEDGRRINCGSIHHLLDVRKRKSKDEGKDEC